MLIACKGIVCKERWLRDIKAEGMQQDETGLVRCRICIQEAGQACHSADGDSKGSGVHGSASHCSATSAG